ncbi:PAS domain S-box protein [Rhizobiales bacterium]|uniref:PAS domain-containing protein n=1 Tax=Hongsoonwoonella zoysiae TaxID=2821844 RepID=UPI001560FDC3|nr:PAS domain-containing protein [Hongsoonwoonella zoysiae]NRG19923.1 PAS domain S-box protein [Hongsoonwoonella zoysiae]
MTNTHATKVFDNSKGHEKFFKDDEIIVSKTDLKGRITYANRIFLDIADYSEREVLGQPHSIIRHPDMPRCIFKLLWDRISSGREIFAYVVNRTKFGDHYWVYAHVTPSFDVHGNILSYHSNRRVPDRQVVTEKIIPLYAKLLEAERSHKNGKEGLAASAKLLESVLADIGLAYDEFIATLGHERAHSTAA